jgi:hypothetical protein
MFGTRHCNCHLQLIGAHETTPHPIQSFAFLQMAAIADAPANHSATKSKYRTVTEIQITAPVSIEFAQRTGHNFNNSK